MAGGPPYRSTNSQRAKPLGNHQTSWIWGRHLVQETLEAQTWPVLELWLADDLTDTVVSEMAQLAAKGGVSLHQTSRQNLVSRCRGEDHQGFAARMAEFPYQAPASLILSQSPWPLTIVLDRIQDPFNFGAMLRSAEVFAATGVVIGSQQQVGVTSQVARSSVGAVNRLPIARVSDLAEFLRTLPDPRPVIVSASEKASTPISAFDFRRPTVLIIGNEGRGISDAVAAQCTASVRIPQLGAINSLNAAAALAVICYEIRRQQAG